MGFINYQQGIIGQVVIQRGRRFTLGPSRQVAGIVFNPVAVAELLDHLEIKPGALLEPLRLYQLVVVLQEAEPIVQFFTDVVQCILDGFPRRYIMRFRKHRDPGHLPDHLPGQRVKERQLFNLVIKQLDPNRIFV